MTAVTSRTTFPTGKMRRRAITLATLLMSVTMLPLPIWSQARAVSDFQQVSFVFELDGVALQDVEIFQSRSTGAMLILSPSLESPILIQVRDGSVETVNLMKVDKQPDGSVALLPNPTLDSLGSFRLTTDGSGVTFDFSGKEATLKEKPDLLGAQNLKGMRGYSIDYVRKAESYTPSGPIVSRLRAQTEDVQVKVFFGSWCSACKQLVPRIMKVHEQLEGSKIKLDYYGLPKGFGGEPEASRMDIHSVPTGVVFVDGQEVGRISGNGWKIPELALNNLLLGARDSG